MYDQINENNITIEQIEALTEQDAIICAVTGEIIPDIKGHTLYLVDFDGYFGYSCLVFHNGRHIYHANDYQLHHRKKTKEQLRDFYIRNARDRKLYCDQEIEAPLASYAEYKRKSEYLRNYYTQRYDRYYASGRDSESDREKGKLSHPYFSSYDWHYYADRDIVDRINHLAEALSKRYAETSHNYEFWCEAFEYEMWNFEYCFNEDDYEIFSVLFPDVGIGQFRCEGIIKACKLTDEQMMAYKTARSNYFSKVDF